MVAYFSQRRHGRDTYFPENPCWKSKREFIISNFLIRICKSSGHRSRGDISSSISLEGYAVLLTLLSVCSPPRSDATDRYTASAQFRRLEFARLDKTRGQKAEAVFLLRENARWTEESHREGAAELVLSVHLAGCIATRCRLSKLLPAAIIERVQLEILLESALE